MSIYDMIQIRTCNHDEENNLAGQLTFVARSNVKTYYCLYELIIRSYFQINEISVTSA